MTPLNLTIETVNHLTSFHVFHRKIPLPTISLFQGRYGIDLEEKRIAKWGMCMESVPISAADYLDPAAEEFTAYHSPLEITFAHAIEYVIRKFNSLVDDLPYPGSQVIFSPSSNGSLFIVLINLRHNGQSTVIPSNGEFVSWFDVICEVLKDLKWVQSLERDPHTGFRVLRL